MQKGRPSAAFLHLFYGGEKQGAKESVGAKPRPYRSDPLRIATLLPLCRSFARQGRAARYLLDSSMRFQARLFPLQ